MSDVVDELPTKLFATIIALALCAPFSAFIERTVYRDQTRDVSWLDLEPVGRTLVEQCLFHHMGVMGVYVALGSGVAALNYEGEFSAPVGGALLAALLLSHVALAAFVWRRARRVWDGSPAMVPA